MARPNHGRILEFRRADGLTTQVLRISAYGKRYEIRLGHEEDGWTPGRAERERHRVAEAIKAGVWVPPKPPEPVVPDQPVDCPTFHELATSYLRRKRLIVDENTALDLRWRITHHLLPFFAPLEVAAITNDTVFDYIEHKLDQRQRVLDARDAGTPLRDDRGVLLRPLSNTSINMTLATLAAILDEPECQRWLPKNPARGKGKRLKTNRRKGNFLEIDELNALIDAAERLDRQIGSAEQRAQRARDLRSAGLSLQAISDEVGVGVSTVYYYLSLRPAAAADPPLLRLGVVAVLGLGGLRVSEAAQLQRKDVDLRRRQLTISDAKTETGIRTVNMTPTFVAVLGRVFHSLALSPSDPALPTQTGTARDKDNIGRLLQRVVREADRARAADGLPALPENVTPHTLRRTYVTVLLESGAPLPYVMAQVGHKDEKTVLGIYARVLQRQGREAIGDRGELLAVDDQVGKDEFVGDGRPGDETQSQVLGHLACVVVSLDEEHQLRCRTARESARERQSGWRVRRRVSFAACPRFHSRWDLCRGRVRRF